MWRRGKRRVMMVTLMAVTRMGDVLVRRGANFRDRSVDEGGLVLGVVEA